MAVGGRFYYLPVKPDKRGKGEKRGKREEGKGKKRGKEEVRKGEKIPGGIPKELSRGQEQADTLEGPSEPQVALTVLTGEQAHPPYLLPCWKGTCEAMEAEAEKVTTAQTWQRTFWWIQH